MTESLVAKEADRVLKAKHRAMWASGDYPAVAADVIPDLGAVLVRACGVRSGQRVLDVGAGTGNVAIPAALTGADVVASDLTPELFDAGRELAAKRGAQLEWRAGDAEALPFPDDEFDVVTSCLGVMFAPHHQNSADELIRVCRPGGTIGLLSWTPAGFIGRMFAAMKPYAPPPPPGAQPPPLWGDETHVRELLGDRVTDVVAHRDTVRVDHFDGPEAFRDYFKANYGPTIAVYKAISGEPDKVAALDRDLVDLARQFDVGAGAFAMDWEYLLLTAVERA
ncbi:MULTISPECIES: class I SAM-dependent methyltransferase [unclassified Rhodococcus (in: high G+C Gram-positive bacteria)]|uniref:class I SAM-dependent methyltransferase n=1 Tax=unclassified Rhodococcus (in: high G+C Gram-positive bacteria) TaxID=192944 RepID=UPI000E0BCFC4|nr:MULTISPECIES: class I SAM-dependent methyltransferase [unclassified Rhodococcus (in: high G+C Gram-positive bacteria)]QKT09701.1 class I SAM-dependent methyltransferase [Rhodococcus sp. W8901]RDI28244.1 methyltransferase family protein [Rhodococcus sp. AG1013]